MFNDKTKRANLITSAREQMAHLPETLQPLMVKLVDAIEADANITHNEVTEAIRRAYLFARNGEDFDRCLTYARSNY